MDSKLKNEKSMCRLTCALLILVLFGWSLSGAAMPLDAFQSAFDGVLKRFVSSGRVDYKGLNADSVPLNRYLDSIAGVTEEQFNTWTEPEKLSLLINLYNAATLKLIVDHYPLQSIKDIGSFFKGP